MRLRVFGPAWSALDFPGSECIVLVSTAPHPAGHLERAFLANKGVDAALPAWALFPVVGSA